MNKKYQKVKKLHKAYIKKEFLKLLATEKQNNIQYDQYYQNRVKKQILTKAHFRV